MTELDAKWAFTRIKTIDAYYQPDIEDPAEFTTNECKARTLKKCLKNGLFGSHNMPQIIAAIEAAKVEHNKAKKSATNARHTTGKRALRTADTGSEAKKSKRT